MSRHGICALQYEVCFMSLSRSKMNLTLRVLFYAGLSTPPCRTRLIYRIACAFRDSIVMKRRANASYRFV